MIKMYHGKLRVATFLNQLNKLQKNSKKKFKKCLRFFFPLLLHFVFLFITQPLRDKTHARHTFVTSGTRRDFIDCRTVIEKCTTRLHFCMNDMPIIIFFSIHPHQLFASISYQISFISLFHCVSVFILFICDIVFRCVSLRVPFPVIRTTRCLLGKEKFENCLLYFHFHFHSFYSMNIPPLNSALIEYVTIFPSVNKRNSKLNALWVMFILESVWGGLLAFIEGFCSVWNWGWIWWRVLGKGWTKRGFKEFNCFTSASWFLFCWKNKLSESYFNNF